MTNTIYLVRHGQTNWNILGKTQGHGNSDLTEKGIDQAKDLADAMVDRKSTRLNSSHGWTSRMPSSA